jgi:hypothetical protein
MRMLKLLGILLLAPSASVAHAAFMLTVTESGGPAIPIVDGGPLDNAPLDPTMIDVNTVALNLLLTNFQFADLAATSNLTLNAPLSFNPATLSQLGQVSRTSAAGTQSIEILATDSNFLFPNGSPKFMASAAADVFRFTTAGDSSTFQSYFGPGNLMNEQTIPSPLLAFSPPVGVGPFAVSGTSPITLLGTQPLPFSITNRTVVTLGPQTLSGSPSVLFVGATTIEGTIPEPAAGSLLAVGLMSVAALCRRSG